MALYPASLERRFSATLADLLRRVTKLESRTAAIDSGFPLALLQAIIDPSYTSGDPMAYINGSNTLSGPLYHLTSYTPAAGDLVIVAPVGGSMQAYVVLGKIT